MKTTIMTSRGRVGFRSVGQPVAGIPDTGSFRQQLIGEITRIRRECRAEGTTALGSRCLFSRLRMASIPDAPRGTNATWRVMQEIRDVAPMFGNFVLMD